MTRSSPYIATLLLVLICSVWSFGQSPNGSQAQAGPARTVSIPVTVTDRSGEPVGGLNASNFSLSQSGQMQTLESVSEVAPIIAGKRKGKVPFVVLDALGSPFTAQGETRKECLQLLAEAATNETPISLSEVDHDGLHPVHDLGTPNSALVSALLQLDKEHSFLAHRDQLKAMETNGGDNSLVAPETDRLRRFRQGTNESLNMMETLLAQLKAFQEMAVALQRAHGRKTVLWLAGQFMVEVNEAEDSINVNSSGIRSPFPVKSATIDYQRTIDLLNDAQISLFPVQMPVDWRHIRIPVNAEEISKIGLREIAQSTGGESMAFSDTLPNLVKRAEDLSTAYYLLTFHPEVPKVSPKWTSLKIRLSEQSLDVRSPSGLFVFSPTK
jgi:VWFA-related protein